MNVNIDGGCVHDREGEHVTRATPLHGGLWPLQRTSPSPLVPEQEAIA